MAIAPAASGNLGKAAPSHFEGTSSEPITTDTGIELEAALPPVAPLESLRPGVAMGSAVAGLGAEPAVVRGDDMEQAATKANTGVPPLHSVQGQNDKIGEGDKQKEEADPSAMLRDDKPKGKSSADHLAGSSAALVGEVDRKFARLLAEV